MNQISEELVISLPQRAMELRRALVDMTFCAQSGNPEGSLSAADLEELAQNPIVLVYSGA